MSWENNDWWFDFIGWNQKNTSKSNEKASNKDWWSFWKLFNRTKESDKKLSLDNLYKLRETNAEETWKLKTMMLDFVDKLPEDKTKLSDTEKRRLKSIIDYLQSRKEVDKKYVEVLAFINWNSKWSLKHLKDWINEFDRTVETTKEQLNSVWWMTVEVRNPNEKWYGESEENHNNAVVKSTLWQIANFNHVWDTNTHFDVNQNDVWRVFWPQLYANMEFVRDMPWIWEKKLVENLISILNLKGSNLGDTTNLSTIKELSTKLNPKLIKILQDNIQELATKWNIYEILAKWPVAGLEKSTNTTLEANKILDQLLTNWFEAKLNQKIDRHIDEKIKSLPENDPKRKALERLKSPEAKKDFFDKMKFWLTWMAISLIEWNKWAWIWTSVSHEWLNETVQKFTNNFIGWVDLTIWFWWFWWKFVPGIWINIPYKKALWENTNLEWSFWTFLLYPYLVVWINQTINSNEINSAGFDDFDKLSKQVWVYANVSTLWYGLTGKVEWSRFDAIQKKEAQLKIVLDNFFDKDWRIINQDTFNSYINTNPFSLKDKEKEAFNESITNLYNQVNISYNANWGLNNDDNKRKYLTDKIKDYYINNLKATALWSAIKEQEKWIPGWDWSWVLIWVQMIAWFLPIPTFWLKYEKNSINYNADKQRELQNKTQELFGLWLDKSSIKNMDDLVAKIKAVTSKTDGSINVNSSNWLLNLSVKSTNTIQTKILVKPWEEQNVKVNTDWSVSVWAVSWIYIYRTIENNKETINIVLWKKDDKIGDYTIIWTWEWTFGTTDVLANANNFNNSPTSIFTTNVETTQVEIFDPKKVNELESTLWDKFNTYFTKKDWKLSANLIPWYTVTWLTQWDQLPITWNLVINENTKTVNYTKTNDPLNISFTWNNLVERTENLNDNSLNELKWVIEPLVRDNKKWFLWISLDYPEEFKNFSSLFKQFVEPWKRWRKLVTAQGVLKSMKDLLSKRWIELDKYISNSDIWNKVLFLQKLAVVKDAMSVDYTNLYDSLPKNDKLNKAWEIVDKVFWKKDKIWRVNKSSVNTSITNIISAPWNIDVWEKNEDNIRNVVAGMTDQWIATNEMKQLYFMLMPDSIKSWTDTKLFNQYFATFLWADWAKYNRANWYENVLETYIKKDPSLIEAFKKVRVESEKACKNAPELADSDMLFWFNANYKFNSEVWSLWRNLDFMPAWVWKVVKNSMVNISDDNVKWFILLNLQNRNPDYFKWIKDLLIKKSWIDLTDNEVLKIFRDGKLEKEVNWKKVSIDMPVEYKWYQSERCRNESFWIKLTNWLKVTTTEDVRTTDINWVAKIDTITTTSTTSSMDFGYAVMNASYNVEGDTKKFVLWVAAGGGEEKKEIPKIEEQQKPETPKVSTTTETIWVWQIKIPVAVVDPVVRQPVVAPVVAPVVRQPVTVTDTVTISTWKNFWK